MNRRTLVTATGVLLSTAVLAACSQNNGETVKPTGAAQGLTSAPVIEAKDFAFAPNRIQVPPGTVKLTVRNTGSQKHAFELYSDEQYKDAVANSHIDGVDPGASQAASFNLPNDGKTYYFRCEIHPERMHGVAEIAGS